MNTEQILVELLKYYYTLKEAYKLEQEERKRISKWWMDVTKQRDELLEEVAELCNAVDKLEKAEDKCTSTLNGIDPITIVDNGTGSE